MIIFTGKFMRRLLFALILILVSVSMLWGGTPVDIDPESAYSKSEFYIEMRDGVKLHTTVYAPRDTSELHPMLIQRTPYGCRPYGSAYSDVLKAFYMQLYMEEGYIIVFQDVRGRYMSEGEFEHMRPFVRDRREDGIDEASDAYDTVDWLVGNVPFNNGCVGFTGGSYPGFYALMGGLSGHPAVKAVSPQAPATDWYMGDDIHHNGALALCDAFSFITGFDRPRTGPEQKQASNPDYRGGREEYSFYLQAGSVDSLTRMINGTYPIKFWNEMVSHPDYDGYWRARDARGACYDISPAVLVVGGHFDGDDLYGTWGTYKAIRRQSPGTDCRIVVGPWAHNAWFRDLAYLGDMRFPGSSSLENLYRQVELPFFNYYLKGQGNVGEIPGIRVYMTGENRWQDFDEWPPRRIKPLRLYLSRGGAVSFDKPRERRSLSAYRSDPSNPVPHSNRPYRSKLYMVDDQAFVSGRPDVVTFVSEPLGEDLSFVGEVGISLKVSVSTTDADFIVKLVDVFPDDFSYDNAVDGPGGPEARSDMGGYGMMVRGDIIRGRYRKSFSEPEPFVPGRMEDIRFAMPDIAHTFRKGHRIMIQVQSSWFPLFDRNPQQFVDIYSCDPGDFIPSDVKVFHQRNAASYIEVNVLHQATPVE